MIFFFKQKTAYEMRISDWSSDVCSSDLWIKSITGIPANSVGTTLPADNSTWEASGFIQVQMASGNPDLYLPMNQPVLQVDCWAAKPNSEKPPWGKANNLAELIKAATYEKQNWGPLPLPAPPQHPPVPGPKPDKGTV